MTSKQAYTRQEGDSLGFPEGTAILSINNRHYPVKVTLASGDIPVTCPFMRAGKGISYTTKYRAKQFLWTWEAKQKMNAPSNKNISIVTRGEESTC